MSTQPSFASSRGKLTFGQSMMMMGVLAAILVFLLGFIVPKFGEIYRDMLGGQSLPALTQLVLNASDVMRNQWYDVVAALVVATVGWRTFASTQAGGRLLYRSDHAPRRWVPAALLVVLIAAAVGVIVIALFMPLITTVQGIPPAQEMHAQTGG